MDETARKPLSKKFWLIPGAVILALVYFWYANPLVVSVTGTGEVSVPATNATISMVVLAGDNNPAAATQAVNLKVNGIKMILDRYGIGGEDLTVSQVTLIPPALLESGQTGYRATVSLQAKLTNYGKTDELVALLYAGGAGYVTQPVLGVEDMEKLDKDALDLALADAAKEAGVIALRNLKFIKKRVAITQVTTPASSAVSSKTPGTEAVPAGESSISAGDTFKVTKVVSVGYKMW